MKLGADKTYPLRVGKDLDRKIEDTCRKTKIRSKAEVMRLSIERGMPILIEQLIAQQAATTSSTTA